MDTVSVTRAVDNSRRRRIVLERAGLARRSGPGLTKGGLLQRSGKRFRAIVIHVMVFVAITTNKVSDALLGPSVFGTGCPGAQVLYGELHNGLWCLSVPAIPRSTGTQFYTFPKDSQPPKGIAHTSTPEGRNSVVFYSAGTSIIAVNVSSKSSCAMIPGDKGSLPNRLAVDRTANLLYFSDRAAGKPAIAVATYDMAIRRDLIVADLQEPEDVALSPSSGHFFFTDIGKDTIERAAMDGSRRLVLLQGGILGQPRTLAVSGGWLYFGDGGGSRDEIGRVTFDGRHQTLLLNSKSGYHPFGLAVVGEFVYATDLSKNIICSVAKTAHRKDQCTAVTEGNRTSPKLSDLTALPAEADDGPCSKNNGNVTHLCLSYPDPEHPSRLLVRNGCEDPGVQKTSCRSFGFVLPQSTGPCLAEPAPKTALIYSTPQLVQRVSIDPAPIGIVTRLSYNRSSTVCRAFAAGSNGTLYTAERNGSEIFQMMPNGRVTSVATSVGRVLDIAVDSDGDRLYWSDDVRSIIWEAMLSNSVSRRRLIDLLSAPSEKLGCIAVSPSLRKLFYVQIQSSVTATLHALHLDTLQVSSLAQSNALAYPTSLHISGAWLYVADSLQDRIVKVSAARLAEFQVVYKSRPGVTGLTGDGKLLYWSEQLVPAWKGWSVKRGCVGASCRAINFDYVSEQICDVQLVEAHSRIVQPQYVPTSASTSAARNLRQTTGIPKVIMKTPSTAATSVTHTVSSVGTENNTTSISTSENETTGLRIAIGVLAFFVCVVFPIRECQRYKQSRASKRKVAAQPVKQNFIPFSRGNENRDHQTTEPPLSEDEYEDTVLLHKEHGSEQQADGSYEDVDLPQMPDGQTSPNATDRQPTYGSWKDDDVRQLPNDHALASARKCEQTESAYRLTQPRDRSQACQGVEEEEQRVMPISKEMKKNITKTAINDEIDSIGFAQAAQESMRSTQGCQVNNLNITMPDSSKVRTTPRVWGSLDNGDAC